jgi:cold shock CspA family protein
VATDLLRTGTVTDFDERVGLGIVTDARGDVFPFHCTAIADGTRTITVGTAVAFRVVAGRTGRWEAGSLVGTGS